MVMAQFHYRAARRDGTLIEDQTEASNESALRTQLEHQGLFLLHFEGDQGWGGSSKRITWRKGLSQREFLVFNQQFLALVKAGLPILRTVDILTERSINESFQQALQDVREEIRGGAAISEAMAVRPKFFPDLYRATIQSGEHTGNLVVVLQRYIAYLKLIISVREKVKKALMYPGFLIFVGFGVVAFLVGYVIPTFADVYDQSNAELPAPTLILLTLIRSASEWGPWVLLGITVIVAFLYSWMKTENGQYQVHQLLLRLPLVKGVTLNNQIIQFCRTLTTIIAGGIPLLQALAITGKAMTNKVMSHALTQVSSRVREGVGLAASLKEEHIFPRMTIEMIEVGESTGSLETMLQEVAEFHEGELDLQLTQLTTWMEPALLLIMGFIVGGLVIVMYLPIFQLAGNL